MSMLLDILLCLAIIYGGGFILMVAIGEIGLWLERKWLRSTFGHKHTSLKVYYNEADEDYQRLLWDTLVHPYR